MADWETMGWLGVDAATVAFVDDAAVRADFKLTASDFTLGVVTDLRSAGVPAVLLNTGADFDVPVEALRAEDGTITMVRMCITDDVDNLDGTWDRFGELEITGGVCLAADPFCSSVDYYRFRFPLPDGLYVAEAFHAAEPDGGTWVLAMRIRRP